LEEEPCFRAQVHQGQVAPSEVAESQSQTREHRLVHGVLVVEQARVVGFVAPGPAVAVPVLVIRLVAGVLWQPQAFFHQQDRLQ